MTELPEGKAPERAGDNLLPLRFLLAFGVMLMHVTGWKWVSFPWVSSFIAISGYLICGSMERSSGYIHFAWKRLLRVGPAFVVSIIFTVIVGGTAALIPTLRGWATMGSTLTNSWNPPLRTLSIEEVLYALLAIWFALRLFKSRTIATGFLVCAAGACEAVVVIHHDIGFFSLAYVFCLSCIVYVWRDRVPWSPLAGLAALSGSVACHQLNGALIALVLEVPLITYAVLCLGLHAKELIPGWRHFGDLSFGIYCYHWPLMVWLKSNGHSGWPLIACTILGACLMAFLSWHLLEGPALGLKDSLLRRPRSSLRAAEAKAL